MQQVETRRGDLSSFRAGAPLPASLPARGKKDAKGN